MAYQPYKKRGEIDLRSELNRMFEGFFPEISKKQPFLLRKFRRNERGYLLPCDCVDKNTKEPDKDTWCPFCFGEGAYSDEHLIYGYKILQNSPRSLDEQLTTPGLNYSPVMVFYVEFFEDITRDDKIVTLNIDKEGNLPENPTRVSLFRIDKLIDYRSDNGRIEYWKVVSFEEKRKFLNGPNI